MGVHSHFVLINRATIEAEIDRLINLLDLADGDADLEDGTDAEDDFAFSPYALGCSKDSGPGCEVSDAGGENVLDMELDEDALALFPIYGEDQSAGPINAVHANQQYDLLRQIADHSDGGSPELVRQLRRRLAVIDARAAANA